MVHVQVHPTFQKVAHGGLGFTSTSDIRSPYGGTPAYTEPPSTWLVFVQPIFCSLCLQRQPKSCGKLIKTECKYYNRSSWRQQLACTQCGTVGAPSTSHRTAPCWYRFCRWCLSLHVPNQPTYLTISKVTQAFKMSGLH